MLGEGASDVISTYHPAVASERQPLSARSPEKLVLPFHAEECKRGVRILSIGSLTPEVWAARDTKINTYLSQRSHSIELNYAGNNVERLYCKALRAIHSVSDDCFRMKGGEKRLRDPFTTFCENHSRHKDIAKLQKTRLANDETQFL